MRYETTALEQAIFDSLKKQVDAVGADSIESAGMVKAVLSQRPEYERQIEALEDNKLNLYEQYQLRKIDLDTYRTLKETLDAQLLKTKNAFAALTSQAKREQEAREKEAQRKSISKELAEATGLTGAPVAACDLRAGAAMVIAGLCAEGTTVIEDVEYIERGYQDIVGKLRGLGADIVAVSEPDGPAERLKNVTAG